MAVCEIVAAEAIVRYPAHQPARIFALLDQFYPYANANAAFRPAPFIPYLTVAPSAWVFPLRFTGGGYSGGGKLMFDSQGNAWVADNFMVGAENQDNRPWSGTLSKFAPNGTPLSPAVTGCRTGGSGCCRTGTSRRAPASGLRRWLPLAPGIQALRGPLTARWRPAA